MVLLYLVTPQQLNDAVNVGRPLKVKSLCKSCKTHRFYAHAHRRVCPEITASVKLMTQQYPDYDVIITGHGFGGALASLCGFELEMARAFTFNNKRHFISFGQPRVGNCHWARKFQQIFPTGIRVTHADDPFPHTPKCLSDSETGRCIELKDRKQKLWAFHHPTQIWYPSTMPAFDDTVKGTFNICNGPNWGEDESCRHRPVQDSMDDHFNMFGVDISSHCTNLIDGPAKSTFDTADS